LGSHSVWEIAWLIKASVRSRSAVLHLRGVFHQRVEVARRPRRKFKIIAS
jgi:hypothetical protein